MFDAVDWLVLLAGECSSSMSRFGLRQVYADGAWNYLDGALETVDRKYGWPIDTLHHHISDGHIVHHLFFTQVRQPLTMFTSTCARRSHHGAVLFASHRPTPPPHAIPHTVGLSEAMHPFRRCLRSHCHLLFDA